MSLTRRQMLIQSASIPMSYACMSCGAAWAQDDTNPHICTEVIMSDLETAFAVAIDENPANDPVARGANYNEAISLYSKKWNPSRRIIRVSFLEEPSYLNKIIENARKWEPHMGIQFNFGSSSPDVLVAFVPGGSWSYIGTDSKYFASRGRESMNFGWFSENSNDEEIRRTTLHEFGHALSLVHEQSHPKGSISWNKPNVYRYYEQQGWGKDKVDSQVFAKYQLSQVNGSKYDPTSIMHYAVPVSFVNDPSDAVGWNTVLSDLDKQVIGSLYPYTNNNLPTL